MTDFHLKRPFKWYWHPYKTWTDLCLGILIYIFFPLQNIARLSSATGNSQAKTKNDSLRGIMKKGAVASAKSFITQWEAAVHCAIGQALLRIPRRPLLKEWGLYNQNLDDVRPKEGICALVWFPLSILKESKVQSLTTNEFGCVDVKELDFQNLPSNVPVVLFFHGGGMTIGDPHDKDGLELAQKVSELESKPIVFVSVDYSLSPDYPFPVAVEEALTVVLYFLNVSPDCNIHIIGISAGANLACVATMEVHRKYPGSIKSSVVLCPMLNPAANTLSYYENSASLYISTEWLRWCWRAYLQIPDLIKRDQRSLLQLDTMDDRLNYDSNFTMWEASQWNQSVLARLVNPCRALPDDLNQSNAPNFVVSTNDGDPLRDDGIDLVRKLNLAGATCKHLQHPGSHWLGSVLDKTMYQSIISSWRDVLFPDVD